MTESIGSSHLPITFDERSGRVSFGSGVRSEKMSVRGLLDLCAVAYDQDNCPAAGDAYVMYQGVCAEHDAPLFERHRIRFDINVIPATMIGCEFIKTKGHYHPRPGGAALSYPEVYQVIRGEASYLFQRSEPPFSSLTDAVLVRARAGDAVLVPPEYGHLTVNAASDALVMCNLVHFGFNSLYEPYEKRRGGAYYEILDGGERRHIPNPRFQSLPPLRVTSACEAPSLGLTKGRLIYDAFVENPDAFDFLVKPEAFPWESLPPDLRRG